MWSGVLDATSSDLGVMRRGIGGGGFLFQAPTFVDILYAFPIVPLPDRDGHSLMDFLDSVNWASWRQRCPVTTGPARAAIGGAEAAR